MPFLLYIHGFNSSELSYKASVLKEAVNKLGQPDTVITPRLSWCPAQAIAQLESIIESHERQGITLLGSSLGGFYAAYLAEKYRLNAILINPAVQAPELLKDYLGPQTNPYTDEEYELTLEHMTQLKNLMIDKPTSQLYWLMLQEGDEVLDYREALKAFPNTARLTQEKKGDHSFAGFERYVDDVLEFAKITALESH